MDADYEAFTYYIFDRAYVDYDRLFRITNTKTLIPIL